MNEPYERTELEHLESGIKDEFGEEGKTKDAILLVAGALVEIAKTLQFFRDEYTKNEERRAAEDAAYEATRAADEGGP